MPTITRKAALLSLLITLVIAALIIPVLTQALINGYYDRTTIETLESQTPDYSILIVPLTNKSVLELRREISNLISNREFSPRESIISLVFDGYIRTQSDSLSAKAKIVILPKGRYFERDFSNNYIIGDNLSQVINGELDVIIVCDNRTITMKAGNVKEPPDGVKSFIYNFVLLRRSSFIESPVVVLSLGVIEYNGILDCTNFNYAVLIEDVFPYKESASGKNEPIRETYFISWLPSTQRNIAERGILC